MYWKGSLFLKETEVHTAIGYMAEKAWMLTEIVVLTMLKDEHAAGFEQTALKYKIRDALQFLQRIWRIGKYKIISCRRAAYETEDVVTYNTPRTIAKRR